MGSQKTQRVLDRYLTAGNAENQASDSRTYSPERTSQKRKYTSPNHEDTLAVILREIKEMAAKQEETNKKLDDVNEQMRREREEYREAQGRMELEIGDLKRKIGTLQARIDVFENEGRKRNVVVKGVEEKSEEDVKRTLKQIFQEKLGTESNVLEATRMGRKIEGRDRPIKATFSSFEDKKKIMREKPKLRGTQIFIENEYSLKTIEIRKTLFKIRRNLIAEDRNAKVIILKETIKINGTEYELVDEGNGGETLKEVKNIQAKNLEERGTQNTERGD